MAQPVYKECCVCGKLFRTKKSHYERRKTCSRQCDALRKQAIYKGKNNPNYGNRGDSNPLFKGGRRLSNYGYWLVYKPEHPNARPNGYIFEHRLIMSEVLGRPLEDWEHVHHKDGNKQNNNVENLMLVDDLTHKRIHAGWFKGDDGNWYKPCKKCGEVKPIETGFYKNKNRVYSWCKKCCLKKDAENKRKRKENGNYGSTAI